MLKNIKFILLQLVLIAILAACSGKLAPKQIIWIKGSDTMLHLTELLAAEYMKENPGISIYVEGGGDSSGD